jgi:serine/threonine protein kinase
LTEARPGWASARSAGAGTAERPGTLIGPYKLLEQIGEGGFGMVFMAEEQALALMDHPRPQSVRFGRPGGSGMTLQSAKAATENRALASLARKR